MTANDRAWYAAGVSDLERKDLAPLLRGELPCGGEIVSSRILRRVVRLRLTSGRIVFGKQHLFPFARVRRRYALRRAPAERERFALEEAARRGLEVPEPLAVRTDRGFLGPRLSVLVTEGLPDGRTPVLEEAVLALNRLAEVGIYHPDLHHDNLRMVGDVPFFLDFQSVRFRGSRGSSMRNRADRLAMLAKFATGLERDASGRVLGDLDSVFASDADREAFEAAVAGLDAAEVAARRRHRLRSSTAVVRERMGLWGARLRLRSTIIQDFDPVNFCEEALEQHPEFGLVRAARSQNGAIVRFRATTKLREFWARATETSGFLAWERTAPWPWATQALYIQRDWEPGGGDRDAPAGCLAKGRAE